MEKQLKKIISYIKKNYNDLKKSDIDGKELVIFATGDFSGEYGYGSSDLQAWGVDKNGKLFWAFASGCSCLCDAGTKEKDLKVFEVGEFNLDNTNILKAIGLFLVDKDEFKKSIKSYSYRSW